MNKSAQSVYTAKFITLQKLKEHIHGDQEYVLHADYMRDVDVLQSKLTTLETVARDLVTALRAQMIMRDKLEPTKLIEHLCWRENDEYAAKLADEALVAAQHAMSDTDEAAPRHAERERGE